MAAVSAAGSDRDVADAACRVSARPKVRYSAQILFQELWSPGYEGSYETVPVKKLLGLTGRFAGTMKGYGCVSRPGDCVEIATQ